MSNKLDFSKELIGRRALVTGGTRGIGAAIAQRLLDAGAKVVVTARSRGETLPAGAAFVAGDVASASGVKAIAAGALEALGGLDILVNNAGGASGFPEGTASIPDDRSRAEQNPCERRVAGAGDDAREQGVQRRDGRSARPLRQGNSARSLCVPGGPGGGRRVARVGSRELDDGREHPRRRRNDGALKVRS
jgi:short chain dehydrogenase